MIYNINTLKGLPYKRIYSINPFIGQLNMTTIAGDRSIVNNFHLLYIIINIYIYIYILTYQILLM